MQLKNKIILLLVIFTLSLILPVTALDAKNSFYSNDELALLEKTLAALEYEYGYDYQIDAPYIYSYSYSKDNFDKKEKAFADIVSNADYKIVLSLYQKILQVAAITDYKMNRYKTETRWKYYTYIKSDLLEPVTSYSALLLKYILKKNSSLSNFLDMQRQSTAIEVNRTYTDKDDIIDTF
jgi:hypothetical protein